MFKFDTQKQLAGARAERQGRIIMASFLGRRTSRLGICGHTSFLTRRALSSLTSPPGLFLTLMGRLFLRRVRTLRAPTGLQNICLCKSRPPWSQVTRLYVCGLSVVSCMSVTVHPSMSLSMCPCVCRVLSMPMPMRLSVLVLLSCLSCLSCLPSL